MKMILSDNFNNMGLLEMLFKKVAMIMQLNTFIYIVNSGSLLLRVYNIIVVYLCIHIICIL